MMRVRLQSLAEEGSVPVAASQVTRNEDPGWLLWHRSALWVERSLGGPLQSEDS